MSAALPDYPEALRSALAGVAPINRVETVALSDCGGRVLAESLKADRDLPPFNRAQMDGYAIRAAEFLPGRSWPVAHKIAAGMSANVTVPAGQCVAIATGAPLPADVDTVIPHEWSDRGDHNGGPVRFRIDSIERGHAVHQRGADAKTGGTLIAAGTLLVAHHLGIAATVGATMLRVRAKPQAAVLTSGDEVVPPTTSIGELQSHLIRNSNGPMTGELLLRFGAHLPLSRHLRDDSEQTITTVREAIAQSDLILTIGGVSAGERDYFPAAFEAAGVRPLLRGASIQPGRPIFVGRTPIGTVVVGLPGNPVSVLACACLFVGPIVRMMLGLDATLPWRDVELATAVKPNAQRRAFRPAILGEDGKATVPSWAGSGDLAHTATTHGLVELPVQIEPVAAGAHLRFLPWP